MTKKFNSLRFLRELSKRHEMTVEEMDRIITKHFNDYRDYYVVSTLHAEGYMGVEKNEHVKELVREDNMARMLYVCSLGPGSFVCDGREFINANDTRKLKVFVTGKGLLYIAEQEQKQKERLWTLFISAMIAILSAVATGLATAYFTPQTN